MDLMKRLAELIPPPWMNMVRYYGALAPNAKIREQVVMLAGPSEALRLRLQQAAEEMGLEAESKLQETSKKDKNTKAKKRASRAWAILMARIFEFLPLLCPRCSSPMKMVGFVVESESVRKVLVHLDLPTEAPMPYPPRAPPQTEMEFNDEYADWPECTGFFRFRRSVSNTWIPDNHSTSDRKLRLLQQLVSGKFCACE